MSEVSGPGSHGRAVLWPFEVAHVKLAARFEDAPDRTQHKLRLMCSNRTPRCLSQPANLRGGLGYGLRSSRNSG